MRCKLNSSNFTFKNACFHFWLVLFCYKSLLLLHAYYCLSFDFTNFTSKTGLDFNLKSCLYSYYWKIFSYIFTFLRTILRRNEIIWSNDLIYDQWDSNVSYLFHTQLFFVLYWFNIKFYHCRLCSASTMSLWSSQSPHIPLHFQNVQTFR